jgi:CHAT domain-containing protein
MPQSVSRHTPHALPRRWRLLLLVGVAVLGGATVLGAIAFGARRGHLHATVLSELTDARPRRVSSALFSVPVDYHPCFVIRARAGETVPRETCGGDAGRLADFEALADAGASSDPDSLQASALLAIIGGDPTEHAADSAIARLSRALLLSPGGVPLLVDLSGAHLVRAERTQNPRDLLAGLDYAMEAADAQPRNTAARFNTALAAQTLGLDEQADIAWTEYLRIDSTSKLAGEARERRRSLRHRSPARSPRPGAPEAEVSAFAKAYPQRARLAGLDSVLGEWGSAHEAGDEARAAELLTLAERLGAPLKDLSLADAVRAIRAAENDAAATRALARAHRAYVAGQRLYDSTNHVAARDSFARVVNAKPPSRVLVLLAEIFQGAGVVYARDYDRAHSIFQELVPRIDSVRHPALAARARWMHGSALLRGRDPTPAREHYQAAARLFRRAGETEFEGAVWAMEGEAAYVQRDTLAAYSALHRSLRMLRGYRSSTWLHNPLLLMANYAATDGMPRAASMIQDEDFAVAMRDHREPSLVEALLGRARIHSINGRSHLAAGNFARAEALVAKIRAEEPRTRLQKTLNYSRAVVAPDTASMEELDSAVAFFLKKDDSGWLLPALLRRADMRLARGDLARATADLDTATARVRGVSGSVPGASLRSAVMEKARERFDQLAMLHLRAGDTIAALRAVERGRVSLAPGYGASARSAGRMAAPAGQVAVEYALIGDTLLTWTLLGTDVRMEHQTVRRGELLARIERSVAALQSPERAAAADAELAWLYEKLVRPVEKRLGPAQTPLVILADGEIAGVPFAALLRDTAQRRYLVEDHPLRFAATLAEAARPAPRANRSARALLVADPAFDRTEYPTLDPLRGARAEVDSLRKLYPGSAVLQGGAATREALRDSAPGVGLIHYAGHAVFDDARPERSALVLAGADTTGRLTAEDVNALDLRGVRLVVLAACRTVRARDGRSGGLAGFSGALIAAGAGGVVGSLWDANDTLTQPLMLAFHGAYLRSGDPAVALRDAQLKLLRSPDPKRSSPAAWAGFRYIGR